MIRFPEMSLLWVNIHTHRLAEDGELAVCHKISENTSFHVDDKVSTHGHTLFSIGLHPWALDSFWLKRFYGLTQNALNNNVIAIGETGLDKKCATPYFLQWEAFEAHIKLSEQLQKPLIIHCVKAIDDVIALYKKYKPRQAWVLHGFRGNSHQAFLLQKMGLYLSFGLKHNVDALAACCIDLMFLETDEGKESIATLYNQVACLKNKDISDLKKKMLHNFSFITCRR